MLKILVIDFASVVIVLVVAFIVLFFALLVQTRRRLRASLAEAEAEYEAEGQDGRVSMHTSVFGYPVTVSNHYVAKPHRYRKVGSSHVVSYIERLIASTASSVSVYFYSTARQAGFGLERYLEETPHAVWRQAFEIEMMFGRIGDPDRESRARAFFENLSITPARDSLEGPDCYPTRVVAWPIGLPADRLTELCLTVLGEACHVAPGEALNITYNDRPYE